MGPAKDGLATTPRVPHASHAVGLGTEAKNQSSRDLPHPRRGVFTAPLGDGVQKFLGRFTWVAAAEVFLQNQYRDRGINLLQQPLRGLAVTDFRCAASAALVIAALSNDFSLAYIMHHSNRALPTPYKFAALWSGQEGSLLFWALLLSTYGFVLRVRHKVDVQLTAYASVVIAAVQVFFLLLVNFAAHPFAIVTGTIPPDGNGLNPLLQYPEMVIHPPMLYLGYVGVTVPFAFALSALIMKYPGEKWIQITRRWTMVTWLFLTCGIFLGMHWAYSVLGWGGYWGWDPVENASLLPWLTGTAFLHSVMMQEKRGMMKKWNMWLIFTTFFLAIFGTFLTRSGVVSSVHAFAQSGIGVWFVWFLAITAAICVAFFVMNYKHLKTENHLESLISRESSFLFNNLLLLVSCFAVLWGTLFPVISEAVTGSKVTVGAPFFNRVNVPIGMFLLLLTGIGPLLAWRKTSLDALRRNFLVPAVLTVVAVIVLMAMGMRPWQEDVGGLYSLMGVALAIFVIATVASEFYRGGRVIQQTAHQRLRRHGAAHPPQHPPLWRIHRAPRRGDHRDWLLRLGLQPGQGAGASQWPIDDHRLLHA